jgi:hypothetical protein
VADKRKVIGVGTVDVGSSGAILTDIREMRMGEFDE